MNKFKTYVRLIPQNRTDTNTENLFTLTGRLRGVRLMEYIIKLSEDYEKCERALNRLGIVTYKSQAIEGLIGYWSKLGIEYLSKRDFIDQIDIAPKGTFVSHR